MNDVSTPRQQHQATNRTAIVHLQHTISTGSSINPFAATALTMAAISKTTFPSITTTTTKRNRSDGWENHCRS
jgi:hypothetical protein